MKLRARFPVVFFLFVLAACGGGQSNFSPPVRQSTGVPRTTQSAQIATTNIRMPVQLTAFVPCANGGSGEAVALSGVLHVLTRTTIAANNLHLSVLFNPQGVSGVGSITGDTYQGTGVTRQDLNVANAGFPLTATLINNFRIIGQGAGNNLLIHENDQFTVNANGQVTVSSDHLSMQCK